MTETAKFSVSGEEFIDNLIEENENLKKEIIRLRKTVVTQEMERNDLFKRFAKVEAELEDYRMQEFNHKMFKK